MIGVHKASGRWQYCAAKEMEFIIELNVCRGHLLYSWAEIFNSKTLGLYLKTFRHHSRSNVSVMYLQI